MAAWRSQRFANWSRISSSSCSLRVGGGALGSMCRRRTLEAVDAFDDEEQRERDDEKLEDRLDEGAVPPKDLLALCVVTDRDRQIREIDVADDEAQRRA